MVSTQLPIVTEAALKVLSDGGDAVDAMITAVFLQHVNDFHQVSHFGAMSAIYYEAATGQYHLLNAVSERPRSDRPDGRGDASKVAVGGVVRGLESLARRFGTRPWASYLEPAIASAEEGVLVTSFMYGINYANWNSDDLIKGNPEARDFYMPDGHLVPAGHRWKMPRLASTLRRVASDGADYLYTGDWARKFVAEATRQGGRVTMEDMSEYRPRWEEPVRFTYRGHEILGSAPPDTGGLVVGYNLNILENFDLKRLGHYTTSAETLAIMAHAFSRVADETRWAIQDPLAFHVPAAVWLSKDYGRMGPSSCVRRCRGCRSGRGRLTQWRRRAAVRSARRARKARLAATTTSSSTRRATGSRCCTLDTAACLGCSSMASNRLEAAPGHTPSDPDVAWCCRSRPSWWRRMASPGWPWERAGALPSPSPRCS